LNAATSHLVVREMLGGRGSKTQMIEKVRMERDGEREEEV